MITSQQKKSNWQVKKLGEVCDIYNGSTPLKSKKEYWNDGNINWFTIKDIREQGRVIKYTKEKVTKKALNEDSIKLLPIKTVLLCCTASVGEWAISEVELTTNQQFNGMVIKNKKELLARYLFYFSSTLKERLLFISGKTTIDFVSMTKLKQVKIPFPPIGEQKRIVKKLDRVFENLEKAKKNAEKNLENSKELFESYLQNIFEEGGDDWEEKELGNCYDVRDGTHDSPKYQTKGHLLITSKNLKGGFNTRNAKLITKQDYKKINNRSKVNKGDILFAMIGTIGTPTVIEFEPDFAIKNVALFKVSKGQSNYFLKYYLESPFVKIKMQREAKGTTQKFVGLGYLRSFPIFLPSLSIQKQIVKKLDALSEKTKKLEKIYQKKLDNLEELKKSILQKAFAGDL